MTRLLSARYARFATFAVLVFVACGLMLNSSGLLSPNVSMEAQIRHAAGLVPSLFYVTGIWMVDRAFRSIERGQRIEAALSTLMKRLGHCLFFGGIAFVFVQPVILKTLTSHWSAWVWFDVPSITLGCLGLLLFTMAEPLRDAATARAEMDVIL
jgi:hypothetical protein